MDSEVLLLWSEMIRVRRWARSEAHSRVLEQHQAVAGEKGRFESGLYLIDMADNANAELEQRAEEWWTCCREVLDAAKVVIGDSNTRELEGVFAGEIELDRQELQAPQERLAPKTHIGKVGVGLDAVTERAKATFHNHIGLLRLRQKASEIPLIELLHAPRYESIRDHWVRSLEIVGSDPHGGIREAVTAIESAAGLLARKQGSSLGDVLKTLRRSSRFAPLLVDSIEKVWAYANATPNVRHGSPVPADVVFAEARFIVDSTSAILRWMLALDRPA